uniref:Uncharacterized protein n=1 Tax=Oryza rufipogon TaxID=4529 RepID=A0A0E0RIF4_ORYRU
MKGHVKNKNHLHLQILLMKGQFTLSFRYEDKFGNSHFWQEILEVMVGTLYSGKMVGGRPLNDRFPELYNVAVTKKLNENDRDKIWWNLTKEGRFTVKSFYSAMKMEQVNFPQKKKTLKIKVFIWLFVGGKGVRIVNFVIERKQFNTCSLIVLWLDYFGTLVPN